MYICKYIHKMHIHTVIHMSYIHTYVRTYIHTYHSLEYVVLFLNSNSKTVCSWWHSHKESVQQQWSQQQLLQHYYLEKHKKQITYMYVCTYIQCKNKSAKTPTVISQHAGWITIHLLSMVMWCKHKIHRFPAWKYSKTSNVYRSTVCTWV